MGYRDYNDALENARQRYWNNKESILHHQKKRIKLLAQLYPYFYKRQYQRSLQLHPDINIEHAKRRLELHPYYYKEQYIRKLEMFGKEELNNKNRENYHKNIEYSRRYGREKQRRLKKSKIYRDRCLKVHRNYILRRKIFGMFKK